MAALSLYSAIGFAVAPINPALGSLLAPGHSEAQAQQVRLQMATIRNPQQLPGLQRLSRATLRHSPLDHITARTFATVDLISRRTVRGNRVMQLVGGATLREAVSHAWLLNQAFRARNFNEVAREADVILRLDPNMRQVAFLMLRALVADGRAMPAIEQRLAGNPPWRGGFLGDLGSNGRSPNNELRLFRQLRAGPTPPTAGELRTWFLKMNDRVDSTELLALYRALAPYPIAGNERFIRDGGFEGTRAFGPLTWIMYTTDHGFAEIGPSPSGRGQSLYAESDGRFNGATAMQMLTVPPGRYVLRYRTHPLTNLGRTSAEFRVTCREGQSQRLAATMAIHGEIDVWKTQSWRFVVPADCRAPYLGLYWNHQNVASPTQFYIDDVAITADPLRRSGARRGDTPAPTARHRRASSPSGSRTPAPAPRLPSPTE